jgi:hypothetical protein
MYVIKLIFVQLPITFIYKMAVLSVVLKLPLLNSLYTYQPWSVRRGPSIIVYILLCILI